VDLILADLWLNLQLAVDPIRKIPGLAFLLIYIVGMVGLPFLLGRRPAGVVLLLFGGYKAFVGMSHNRPVSFLVILLIVTIFTHLISYDQTGSSYGGSCSGGGFFFFGGGGCGSSCGSGCGSSCGGGCGGACGGCG